MELWHPNIDPAGGPIYLEIVQALSDDIASGRLGGGTKLPTHRELADLLGVAIGTVTRAYAEAERRGLIRSEGRRGTFVGSARSSRSYLAAIAGDAPGIDMSKNHPDYALDPQVGPTLREIARDKSVQQLLEYPPAAGFDRHREAGAAWFNSLGASGEAGRTYVTAGAQHALSVVVAAETRPGDIIAAEQFTYPGIRAIAEQVGLHLVGLPLDDDGIIPAALETVCRQRKVRLLYCNPSLQNPTDTISPESRRVEIAAICERYGVIVVEDEIMRPMLDEHPGFISGYLPDQGYLVVSASKAVAAGLRVGFVLAPESARQRMIEGLNASCLGVPPLTAELLARWLDDGTVRRVIARRREELAARHALAAEILSDFHFRAHPSGYHLWLHLPEAWTGLKLAMEAQLRGVVITPAEAFAAESGVSTAAVRLSIGVPPSRELLRRGLNTLVDVIRGGAAPDQPTV